MLDSYRFPRIHEVDGVQRRKEQIERDDIKGNVRHSHIGKLE